MSNYDSYSDTMDHIADVQKEIYDFVGDLRGRAAVHDQSKLFSPEKELFDELTPLLKTLTYGPEEYTESLKRLKPALDHHYANNSHHAEFHEKGIDGMNLLDLVEMWCDWKAAVKRTKDGDIKKSLEINRKRFKLGDQLYNILSNSI